MLSIMFHECFIVFALYVSCFSWLFFSFHFFMIFITSYNFHDASYLSTPGQENFYLRRGWVKHFYLRHDRIQRFYLHRPFLGNFPRRNVPKNTSICGSVTISPLTLQVVTTVRHPNKEAWIERTKPSEVFKP